MKKILCLILSLIMLFGATFTVGCAKSEFTVTFDANGGYFIDEGVDQSVSTIERVVTDAKDIEIPLVK